MDPRAAILAGKLSFRGDVRLARRLKKWLHEVVIMRQKTGLEMEMANREAWQPDADAKECPLCHKPFKVPYAGPSPLRSLVPSCLQDALPRRSSWFQNRSSVECMCVYEKEAMRVRGGIRMMPLPR